MSYKLIVEFEREQSDDAGVIGKLEPTPKEFAKQLAIELQEAYDELAIAGHFQVIAVKLGDKQYDFDGVSEFI